MKLLLVQAQLLGSAGSGLRKTKKAVQKVDFVFSLRAVELLLLAGAGLPVRGRKRGLRIL